MKKPNKQVEAHRSHSGLKRAERVKARKQIRRERLNHKANVILAEKQALFDKWVAAVNTYFESQKK
jgi:hypothetical protein